MTILFFVLLLWFMWKVFVLGLKATWGIAKIMCMVFLLPVILAYLVIVGLLYIALPVLVIAGLVALFRGNVRS